MNIYEFLKLSSHSHLFEQNAFFIELLPWYIVLLKDKIVTAEEFTCMYNVFSTIFFSNFNFKKLK